MPLVEVDESELTRLRNAASTMDKIGGNTKTRQRLLGLIKEVAPEIPIPELDAAAPVLEELKKRDEDIAALRKEIEEDKKSRQTESSQSKFTSDLEKARTRLRTAGYTDEGIEQVEKLMTERGIVDHEAAAALFDKLNPPASPASPSYGGNHWNFAAPTEADADHKAWLANPTAQSQVEIRKFFAERNNGGRR